MPPEVLTQIFPENLVRQEMCPERWIEIPEPVRDIYALWRPTPLLRAVRLEQALKTPAHIYYKYEGASPAGSHKPNTSVAQAYFNKVAGTKRLATETGAGQWGPRWRWPASCSAWSATSIWSRSATSTSRIAGC